MQYILITGASTGIGYTTSKYLVERGYFVFGSVRKEADGKRLENQLGRNFKALIFDVRDEVAIKKAKLEVENLIGEQGLTGLVNNAGIVVTGPMKHLETSAFENQFDVNVFGVVNVTRTFLPLLGASFPQKNPPGKIINISSVAALITNPFAVPYSASKKALEAITEGLRKELLIYGIDVISIQPGAVKTPIWGKAEMTGNPYEGTDYEGVMSMSNKMIAKYEVRGMNPLKISELIHKILIKKSPKVRYTISNNLWVIRLVNWLPARWVDKMLLKKFKKIEAYYKAKKQGLQKETTP